MKFNGEGRYDLQKIISYLQIKYNHWNLLSLVLFGSVSIGRNTRSSDIDLLAVFENVKSEKSILVPLSPPHGLTRSTDLLAVSKKECENQIRNGNGFYIEIFSNGKCLLEDLSAFKELKDLSTQTITNLGMIKSRIGWKKTKI